MSIVDVLDPKNFFKKRLFFSSVDGFFVIKRFFEVGNKVKLSIFQR